MSIVYLERYLVLLSVVAWLYQVQLYKAVIQRNPLASPDVIGISKGASLAAVIIIMIFPTAPLFVLPIGSFLGAFAVSLFYHF